MVSKLKRIYSPRLPSVQNTLLNFANIIVNTYSVYIRNKICKKLSLNLAPRFITNNKHISSSILNNSVSKYRLLAGTLYKSQYIFWKSLCKHYHKNKKLNDKCCKESLKSCSLFNDAFSIIKFSVEWKDDRWVGKDVEGSGRGLI
jgi:hypothetical protein